MEDHLLKPTDALVLVANTEDEDYAILEVHVYEEDTGNLYVHHDIALPAFPICLAWGSCPSKAVAEGQQAELGNFVAVGTFNPAIEIWDLDVIDPLEPVGVLGGQVQAEGGEEDGEKRKKKKKKKGKKGPQYTPGSHEGPIMGLDWNAIHKQVLASGSADMTVKLWDVTTQTCSHTCNHHKDKVVAVKWHPCEVSKAMVKGLFFHMSNLL